MHKQNWIGQSWSENKQVSVYHFAF